MRVILAIAERYQPRSVKPRSDPKHVAQQQYVHHMTKEGSPDRSHMTKPGSPDYHMTNRVQSPDRLQRDRNSSQDVSRLAANSVSVPNMAALPRERSLSQPASQLLPGYGPPRHNTYSGLSQPDRPYYERAERPYERINELAVKGLSNSLSQTDFGENDTYSTPIDQLPSSAALQIIAKGEQNDVIQLFHYIIGHTCSLVPLWGLGDGTGLYGGSGMGLGYMGVQEWDWATWGTGMGLGCVGNRNGTGLHGNRNGTGLRDGADLYESLELKLGTLHITSLYSGSFFFQRMLIRHLASSCHCRHEDTSEEDRHVAAAPLRLSHLQEHPRGAGRVGGGGGVQGDGLHAVWPGRVQDRAVAAARSGEGRRVCVCVCTSGTPLKGDL